MNSAGIQDWVFWVTGGLFALGGLTLGAWALFWDRSRGRKRCPKCWYDMSGAVATVRDGHEMFTCPECGHMARSENQLLAVRRRWRWIGPAAALGLAAVVAFRFPEVRAHGWPRLIPTSVLVYLAPMDDPAWRSPGPGNAMSSDLARRLRDGQLSEWQSQVCFDRYYKALPDEFANDWQVRDECPANTSIVMMLDLPSASGLRLPEAWARARVAGIGSIWVNGGTWMFPRGPSEIGYAPSAPASVRIELQIVAPGSRTTGRGGSGDDAWPVHVLWRGEKALRVVPAPAPALP